MTKISVPGGTSPDTPTIPHVEDKPPMTPQDQPEDRPPPLDKATLKSALKAFRKRLKLADDYDALPKAEQKAVDEGKSLQKATREVAAEEKRTGFA